MFCGYCGANIPDNAEFCGNCGNAVLKSGGPQGKRRGAKAWGMGHSNAPFGHSGKVKLGRGAAGGMGGLFGGLGNLKNDKKKLGIMLGAATAAVVVLVVTIAAAGAAGMNRKIAKLEEEIYRMDASGFADEEATIQLFKEYDSLSESNKRKVSNRQTIIAAYQRAQELIAQYKQAAGQVDQMINAINYSNIYAQASTVKEAVIAYNGLGEKPQKYVESVDRLRKALGDVENLDMSVTADNFWDLFAIEYAVGEKGNYGSGTNISQSGYTIYWDRYGGSVTPNYDINTHNDYATPVYIYVASRYPNLTSSCSFYINLHQTYKGIGLIDSKTHEFKLQSGTIAFDSSQGVGEYLINVEDKDSSKSLWNLFGVAYDWNDMVHKMDPFDVSRVEISDISGTIRY